MNVLFFGASSTVAPVHNAARASLDDLACTDSLESFAFLAVLAFLAFLAFLVSLSFLVFLAFLARLSSLFSPSFLASRYFFVFGQRPRRGR